jgi:anti-sigma B factor antagonist
MSVESTCPVQSDEPEPLLVDVAHDGDTAVVRLTVSGEVDGVSTAHLQNAFLSAVRRYQPGTIEMNVRGVTFLDSAGIRCLVQCQADARQVGCHITLVDTSPAVYRVLEISALLDHFGIHRPAES